MSILDVIARELSRTNWEGSPREVARKQLDDAINTIRLELTASGACDVPGLGKFIVTERAARRGRNPRTGEAIDIPARRTVTFRPAKRLRDAVATSVPAADMPYGGAGRP